jgi:hypothetical protein
MSCTFAQFDDPNSDVGIKLSAHFLLLEDPPAREVKRETTCLLL